LLTTMRRWFTEVMTPREKLIVGSPKTTLEEAMRLLGEHKLEKLPLVESDGSRLRGL